MADTVRHDRAPEHPERRSGTVGRRPTGPAEPGTGEKSPGDGEPGARVQADADSARPAACARQRPAVQCDGTMLP
jgi:hypothetical protein